MPARPWFGVTNEVLEDELSDSGLEIFSMAQLAQYLCGFFTLIQQGGLAGSSFHLGTKKEAGHFARPL